MAYQALVIDDNSVCAAVLSGLLKKYGVVAAIEENGIMALQREDLISFDLVFTDYLMPELNGIEIAAKIKEEAQKRGRKIPIILCTANVDEIKGTEQENISMVLQKPVKQEELQYVLQRCSGCLGLSAQEDTEALEEKESIKIPGLDLTYALKMSGDINTYKKILKEYYKTIDRKINVIRRLGQKYEVKAFKIEVHGLKSASRLIGALEFAQFCEKIEKECESYDKETLLTVAEELIFQYGKYRELLVPYVEIEAKKENQKKAGEEQVKQWLLELKTALEDFNFDEAEKLINIMKEYRLPEGYSDLLEKLQEKIESIDYDGGIAMIDTIL